MSEKVYVYVYPNPRGKGVAKTGYFIGDPFDSMADAKAFVGRCNKRDAAIGRLGKCRLVPESALTQDG